MFGADLDYSKSITKPTVEKMVDIREKIAFEIKGVMPTIILDYVNNNGIIQLRDCLMLADQILVLVRQWSLELCPHSLGKYPYLHSRKDCQRCWEELLAGCVKLENKIDRTNLHEWGSPRGLPKGWRGRIMKQAGGK